MVRDSQLKALIFGGVAAAAPDSTTEGKKIKKKNSRLLSVESRSVGDDTFRHGPAPSGHGIINCIKTPELKMSSSEKN